MGNDVNQAIQSIIDQNDVVLFMKGNIESPMCGFSAAVVQILNHIDISYKDVNVLEDENIRQGIKEFSDWPTIPQLYVKGEFVGGCDIIREMYMSGELSEFLTEKDVVAASA